MRATELIEEFARRTGCGAKPNEDGVVSLLFDGRHTVVIETAGDAGTMTIYAVVARMPPPGEERSALAERLLALNLFGAGTGAASFAVDPLEDEVILNRVLAVDRIDYATFEAALEDFVSRLENAGAALAAPAPQRVVAPEPASVPTGLWIRG